MKWRFRTGIKMAAVALASALPFLATESQAMPSFARQTGMVCNSCHIGTDVVPNFTRTGRLFAMRGYTRPMIREKLRQDGLTTDGEPQYGGDYISLNMLDFFAMRMVSEFVQQAKLNGEWQTATSRPMARVAMFYTGPITDWLGLWNELAYLGNNSINSVTVGNTGPTGLNFYAYDEFRLSTSRAIGSNSFVGMSFGNEPGDVVTQFVFPIGIPRMFSLGQGGVGRFMEMATLSFHGLFDDRLWLQFAPNTGVTNNRIGDGWQQYYAIAYNLFRQTENDLWLGLEYSRGNDNASILTPTKSSFICPTTCPAGVTDSQLSFSNTLGGRPVAGAPVERVDKFRTYSWRVEWAVADRGPHTWLAMLQGSGTKQDYVSGASAKRNLAGAYIRYFFMRTYGIEAAIYRDFNYKYTTPTGNEVDFGKFTGKVLQLMWNPAMNVSFHLRWTPNARQAVYTEGSSAGIPLSPNVTSSYNIGMEYSF
jgi:hypothetical protein